MAFGVDVPRTRVVVLGKPSLFTEGIAARLGQHADQVELVVVDSREADAMARAIAARPAVVLVEANDEHVDRPCPLGDLLEAVPAVRLIRLDPSEDRIRVVTSEQRTVNDPIDLINVVLTPL
jgi:DNA-binding NarL/FixJ family response regulator